jgi:hypothetical protein
MKALELADNVEKNWSTGYREQIVSELRRLAAVEAERDGLRAARIAYASEFPPIPDGDDAGLPAVGSIHENIRRLKAENALLEEVNAQLREQNDAVGEACAKYEAELERIKALEPVAVRYDFDGYGWQYIDSGSGSDWLTRHKDGEALYALGGKP